MNTMTYPRFADIDGEAITDLTEPLPSSIVMTEGEYGTAWQRYFSDGLWHRVGGGRPRTWEWLLAQRRLVLVHDAKERTDG